MAKNTTALYNIFILFKWITISVIVSCLFSCNENVKPTTWKEFHGNNANSGFTNYPSKPAVKSKWHFTVGDVFHSSPVIGDDGTIYVGNSSGDVFAINPDGTQKWKIHLVGHLSSPAIGADDNIYINNIQMITPTNHITTLFSLTPLDNTASMNWYFPFPDHGYSTASPKTWSLGTDIFIFVPVHTDKGQELFILDKNGKVVIRQLLDCTPDELVGGYSNPFEFRVQGITFDAVFSNDPSVAIAEIGGVTNKNKPVIVIGSPNCHLMGFEWDPAEKVLRKLWTVPGTYPYYPSPAVTNNGVVIFGHEKILSAYNLMTGVKTWDYKATSPNDYDGFYEPPAILLSTIVAYNNFHNGLIGVDDNGVEVHKFSTANDNESSDVAPLVTTNFVYVAFPSGLYTLDLNLAIVARADLIGGTDKNVLSSPAIGADGSIYIVDGAGELEAF